MPHLITSLSSFLLVAILAVIATTEGREIVKRTTAANTGNDECSSCTSSSCCQDGRDGLPGLTGRDGIKGEKGQEGYHGPPGVPGRHGASGPHGAPGPVGPPGVPGQRGQQGANGEQGQQGADGDPGYPGPPGRPGPPGSPGHPGCPGPIGLTGDPGLEGMPGSPGVPGLHGPTGQQGRDGSKGETGAHGSPGIDGVPGVPGIPGVPGPRGPPGSAVSGGDDYVRWGRTVCPSIDGTDLVYSGWAVGSGYNDAGSGSNYLCLTKIPQYLSYSSATNRHATVYGAEYEADNDQPYHAVHDQDVPCAVCHVVQRSVLMIPGQYTCPTGWTREYYGYLVSAKYTHHRSTYECMDVSPEIISGGQDDEDGALFYHVEARCGSLACPPYEETKELTCAVCSK